MEKTIEERVHSVVVEHLGVDLEKVKKPGASFEDDLGADSLDTVELLMAYEEEFKIQVDDDEAEKVKTVEDAVNLVTKLVGEQDARS